MELTSTEEIFNFRARNGYADAAPLPMDLDDDGVHDRCAGQLGILHPL